MDIKKVVSLGGLLTVIAATSPLVLAQDAGFFAGMAGGQSKVSHFCDAATSCDDSATAWKIFGGYQFTKTFGAEIGYVNFGNITSSSMPSGVPVTFDAKIKGWEFVGVASLPITESFSVYGKLGFFNFDVEYSGSVAGAGTPAARDRGTDLTFGVGLKYDATKTIGARIELQRYNDVGAAATTLNSPIDMLSLGVVFKF